MLKPVVTRNLMLDFIPDEIGSVEKVNPHRVYKLNDKKNGDGEIVYVMSRELRVEDNWGLLFAKELAEKNGKKLRVVVFVDEKLTSERQRDFLKQLNNVRLANPTYNLPVPDLLGAGVVVVDFNPIASLDWTEKLDCAVFEVDSHNIIPARFISDKQEFSAATLRRKIYGNIADFLTEYPQPHSSTKGEAASILEDFIQNKLEFYAEQKNDPNIDVTSGLSPYLHFGLISSQRIAIEVLKSNVSRTDKEIFLEELIVRKELADNYCLHNNNYKSLDGALNWAKESLKQHESDIRTYVYDLREFENSQTHDELWNAAQRNLLKKGKIHGYLRMYWAKKILEWSKNPQEALDIAIYLNDKYALDGNDPNGYVGILWSIAGLHDRAFQDRFVTGKIRYMSLNGCKKKFDVDTYINEFSITENT